MLLRPKVNPWSYAVVMEDTLSMESSHQSVYVHMVLVVDFVLVSEIFLYLNNSIYTWTYETYDNQRPQIESRTIYWPPRQKMVHKYTLKEANY